jgi:hypothetical protein
MQPEATSTEALTAAALSRLTGAPVLECLGRQPAPPTVASDLAQLARLSPSALERLWTALEPNLGAINTPASLRAIEAFCESHRVDPESLARAVGACRFLCLRGAERGLASTIVEQDGAILFESAAVEPALRPAALACLRVCYERAFPLLRDRAVAQALTDHGRVVTDVVWRVDHVSHANTGEAIRASVTLLTLRYREGERSGQTTFQLLPEQLLQLQRACEDALR